MSDNISFFRKAAPPALGSSFEGSDPRWVLGSETGAAPVLMFDLSRLTWADYAEMRWHPQVNASLSLITFILHQADWKIVSDDKRAAALVEENLRLIWTELVRGISQAYIYGYSPMVLEWDNSKDGNNIFIDKVRDLHPAEAEINWLEVESGYRPPDYKRTDQIPKVKVFDGIKKKGLAYPVPVEHSFWYCVFRENNDYTGRKLLKPAFGPWYFSNLIHLYANRYFERFGEPTPIGRFPRDGAVTFKDSNGADVTLTGKQIIESAIVNLRVGNGVTLPSDRDLSATGLNEFEYSLEYLESQMRGADFERYLDRLDEEISLAIFTPLLLMRSGDRGSLNLGVQHTQTWLTALNALIADIKEYVDPYLCERIKAFNISPNAPRVEWVPRVLGKDNSETIRAMITQLLANGQVKPSIEEMGVALGMTLEEIKGATGLQPLNDRDIRDRSTRTDRTEDKPDLVDGDRPESTRV